MARSCKEVTVYGNCAQVGHQHRECLISTPKCPKCGGNHRAKDHKSGTTTIIAMSSPFGLNLYRQLVHSHRGEGKTKFISQINGFVIKNKKAKKMTGFTWPEFYSTLLYKAPCKYYVNFLEIAG